MYFLIFSDSHGEKSRMEKIILSANPDVVIHLGDGNREFENIKRRDKTNRIYISVKGNCDTFCDAPVERSFEFEGKKFLILHGYTVGVKHGTEALEKYAASEGADIVLYGHTHIADERYLPGGNVEKDIVVMNPGSIGTGSKPSYGTISIVNGQIITNTVFIDW